jgi:hypothetical protein
MKRAREQEESDSGSASSSSGSDEAAGGLSFGQIVSGFNNPVASRTIIPAGAAGAAGEHEAPLSLDVAASFAHNECSKSRRVLAEEARRQAYPAAESDSETADGVTEPWRAPYDEGPYKTTCFLCAYGNRAPDSTDIGAAPYVKMCNMIEQCFGRMSLDQLCVNVANYYTVQLYRPDKRLARARGERTRLPRMKPAVVEEHILRHTKNAVIRAGMLNDMVYDALTTLRRDYPQGRMGDMANVLHKLGTLWTRVATIRKQDLMFTGGDGDQLMFDPAAIGQVANLRRVAPILQQREDTLGGATASDTTRMALRGSRPQAGSRGPGEDDAFMGADLQSPL